MTKAICVVILLFVFVPFAFAVTQTTLEVSALCDKSSMAISIKVNDLYYDTPFKLNVTDGETLTLVVPLSYKNYIFKTWNDGVTANNRTFRVEGEDIKLTAIYTLTEQKIQNTTQTEEKKPWLTITLPKLDWRLMFWLVALLAFTIIPTVVVVHNSRKKRTNRRADQYSRKSLRG